MEPLEHFKQTWSPLQYGRPALTAQTIPHVSAAVQSGIAEMFMRDFGYLVDHQGHSVFCLEAVKGGLAHDSDLRHLTNYPNGYGLHLVTGEVVRKVQSRVVFTSADALADAPRLVRNLERQFTEVSYAAGLAVAVTEAGLLRDSDLAPLIALGSDCGYELLMAVTDAVDALWPHAQRQCRNVLNGVEHCHTPFETEINGTNIYMLANERNCFYLDWPEVTDGFLEMHILLTKTLDAMSHYLVPFHTPASALGLWGQYGHGVSETYEAVQDDIEGMNREEIAEFLLAQENPDELGWLGMELAESEGDDDVLERSAALLFEMADVERNFSYRLTYGEEITDAMRLIEMTELLSQAQEIIRAGSEHSRLAEALCEALKACIDRAPTHVGVSELIAACNPEDAEQVGFENSPDRFFDCIWVLADERHEALHDSALDGFNADMDECGHQPSAVLPLANSALVARVTQPILERTNQCLALLRQIQLSLEVA